MISFTHSITLLYIFNYTFFHLTSKFYIFTGVLLIRRCRHALQNGWWSELNKTLEREDLRVKSMEKEAGGATTHSIDVGMEELIYIRALSLVRVLVPELQDAMKKGRPNLSNTERSNTERKNSTSSSSLSPNRNRSGSTGSNSSVGSEDGTVSPSTSPAVSNRMKRLRRLSSRKEKKKIHDYEERAALMSQDIQFPKIHGSPCTMDSSVTTAHIEKVVEKASLLEKPTDTIRILMRQAQLVIQLR